MTWEIHHTKSICVKNIAILSAKLPFKPYHKADAIALKNPRPDVDPGRSAIVDLSPDAWPGQFTVVSFTVTVEGVQTQLPSQQPIEP